MARIVLSMVCLVLLLASSPPLSAADDTEASLFDDVTKIMLAQLSGFLSPPNKEEVNGNDGIASIDNTSSTIPSPALTGNVHQCTCNEADECIAGTYQTLTTCRLSCKSHLDYFGMETDEYVSCFPKNPTAAISLNYCLKNSASGYCAADPSRLSFISKPNYDRSSTNAAYGIDFKKLASLAALEHLKSFHYCADVCLKQNMLACFEKKSCGIKLPDSHDLADVASFCPAFQSSAYSNTMESLQCLAVQRFTSQFWTHFN